MAKTTLTVSAPEAVLSEQEMMRKAAELLLLKAQKKEMEDKIAEIENVFKGVMDEEGVTELEVGSYRVKYTPATRTGIDSKRLQAEIPAIWEKYLKVTKYKRFELKLK